jgi:hypothetical protein
MRQAANVTGIVPAACSAGPSRRASIDPVVEWDGDRIAALRQALRSLILPDAP